MTPTIPDPSQAQGCRCSPSCNPPPRATLHRGRQPPTGAKVPARSPVDAALNAADGSGQFAQTGTGDPRQRSTHTNAWRLLFQSVPGHRRTIVDREPSVLETRSDRDESAWGAVPALLLVRFPRPLAEPGVRLSPHRALHDPCRRGLVCHGPFGEVGPASPIPAATALSGRAVGHRRSPMHLSALQHPSLLVIAAALPHVRGLSPARSTTAAPSHPWPVGRRCAQPAVPRWPRGPGQTRGGSRVHLSIARRRRHPTRPLRHRRGYPAARHHSLPSVPPTVRGVPRLRDEGDGCASLPAQIRQVRAGASLRGVERRFLAYAFPSRSPHPRRLAVPTRHGFVRAACHPPRHLPGQAALSFAVLLRQNHGPGLSPQLDQQAPHGAPAQ